MGTIESHCSMLSIRGWRTVWPDSRTHQNTRRSALSLASTNSRGLVTDGCVSTDRPRRDLVFRDKKSADWDVTVALLLAHRNINNISSCFHQLVSEWLGLFFKSLEVQTSIDQPAVWLSDQWQPNHLTFKSIDNVTKSLEFQIRRQPNPLNLKSIDTQVTSILDQSITKKIESQIDWQPNHLNLKSFHNKFQTSWQQFASISQQLTTNSLESEEAMDKQTSESLFKWQSKSVDNHAAWTATRFNLTSIDFRINAARPFPIGSLWLETGWCLITKSKG